jgi:hypothetical protein
LRISEGPSGGQRKSLGKRSCNILEDYLSAMETRKKIKLSDLNRRRNRERGAIVYSIGDRTQAIVTPESGQQLWTGGWTLRREKRGTNCWPVE